MLTCFPYFQGVGTDEKCLIEILASRTNQQTHALVEAYKNGDCIRSRDVVVTALDLGLAAANVMLWNLKELRINV